ncbi:MAG TPA: pyridoxal phosphate-dependent aminotransferase [Vicinamibacterales bacterium]|nr:pyridoxal phosphate-dependent aminotransferase [Vicinamibacterales bacterium]
MLNFRSRMDAIQAPIIAVVGDLIRQTPGTISLGQGVVHYGPPAAAMDVAREALSNRDTHGYQDGSGNRALIVAIEEKLLRDNGIDRRNGLGVMVTAGGNMAFVHAILAITNPGDEVILPVPFYFNHEMAIQMVDCTAVLVATDDEYQLDLDAIRRAMTPRTRAIVTVTPNNPTGAVFPEVALRAVNELCRERGVFHISDEVYEYFTYGSTPHVSPGAFAGARDHTISLFSLSKAYGFAGWRIGYMVYPERLNDAIAKVQDTVLVCPPVISQIAAVAAMAVGPAYCRQHLAAFAEVRDSVMAELRSLEPLCTVPPADGAFYCFLRVNAEADPMRTAERLIREHRVAVVPGHAFGVTSGCYFRVAYGALQKATVAEGIGRLVMGLRAILER